MTSRPALDPDALLEHAVFVRQVARAALRGDDLVDDVVQDTMLAALQAKAPPRGPLRAWLGGVARIRARNLVRQRVATRAREARATSASPAEPAVDVLARAEIGRRRAAAVVSLDEPYRRAVLMRYFDGLAPREMARALGVPVETARTHVKRGLAQLRARLESAHADAPGGWRAALLPLASTPLGLAGTATAASLGGIVMGKKALAIGAALAALVGAGVWLRPWDEKEEGHTLASHGEDPARGVRVAAPGLASATAPILAGPPVDESAQALAKPGSWCVRVRVPGVAPPDMRLVATNAVGELMDVVVSSEVAPGETCLEGATSEAGIRPTHVCASGEGWMAQAAPIVWSEVSEAARAEGRAALDEWSEGIVRGHVRDLEGQPVPGLRLVLAALRRRPYYEELESPHARIRSLLLREQPFVEVTTDPAGDFTVHGFALDDQVLSRSVDPAWLILDETTKYFGQVAAAANNPGLVSADSHRVLELVALSRVMGVARLESGLDEGGNPLAHGGWRTLGKRTAPVPEGALRSPGPIPQFMVRSWPQALSLESVLLGPASLYDLLKGTSLGSATIKALGYRPVDVEFHAWQVGRPFPPPTILEPLRPGSGGRLTIRLTADPHMRVPSAGTVGVHVVDGDDDPTFRHGIVMQLQPDGDDALLVTSSDIPAGVYHVYSGLWEGLLEVRPGRVAVSAALSSRHLRLVEITAQFPPDRGWSGIETTLSVGTPKASMTSAGWRNLRRLHQEDPLVGRVVHAELGEHLLRYWLRVNVPDAACPVSVRASGEGLDDVERDTVALPSATTAIDLSPWPTGKEAAPLTLDRD